MHWLKEAREPTDNELPKQCLDERSHVWAAPKMKVMSPSSNIKEYSPTLWVFFHRG